MAEEWDKIKEFVTANAGLFEEMYSNYDYRKVLEFISEGEVPETLKDQLKELSEMADKIQRLAIETQDLAREIEDIADDAVETEL